MDELAKEPSNEAPHNGGAIWAGTITLSDELFEAYISEFTAHSPAWREWRAKRQSRRRKQTVAGTLCLLAGIAVFAVIAVDDRMFDPRLVAAIGGLLLISGGLLFQHRSEEDRLARMHEAQSRSRSRDGVDSYNVELSVRGIRTYGPGYDTFQAWSRLLRIDETASFLMPSMADRLGVVLVKSQVGTPSEVQALAEKCRALIREASASEDQRIARFLAVRDAACSTCKHNLRGCDGRACPECGMTLSIAQFPDAVTA